MKESSFNFWVDIDQDELEKASKEQAEGKYDNMYLSGTASNSSKDADGEELDTHGFVLDRFLTEGLINYEHLSKSGGPRYIIGEPVEAKVNKNSDFVIKAKLWKGKQIAEDLWDTLHVMRDNKSKRRIGWSIEGKALARDPMNNKKITKAQIHHVALTFMPKNYNTFADIVKGEQKEDFIEPEVDQSKDPRYIYEFEKAGKCYGVKKNFEIEEKEEDEEDEEEKAVTTANTEPLRKESVDKKTKNIVRKALRTGKISPKKAYKFIKSFYNS